MKEQHENLKQYVNDVVAMERQITQMVSIQVQDERIQAHSELMELLEKVLNSSGERMQLFKELSDEEGGGVGAALKEGVTAVAGTLTGIYEKVREHPVSRMVRDDVVAMDVASVSYGMLLTLGIATGHTNCADLARRALGTCPPLVIQLTDILPSVVVKELAEDAPLANPGAAKLACSEIRDAWNSHR